MSFDPSNLPMLLATRQRRPIIFQSPAIRGMLHLSLAWRQGGEMKDIGTVVVILIGLVALVWTWVIPWAKEMWGYANNPSRLVADLLDWAMWFVVGFAVLLVIGFVLMARDRWVARPQK